MLAGAANVWLFVGLARTVTSGVVWLWPLAASKLNASNEITTDKTRRWKVFIEQTF